MKTNNQNTKNIIADLRCDHKQKIMLYIDKNIQNQFKFFCKNKKIKMSTLVERLLKEFLKENKD